MMMGQQCMLWNSWAIVFVWCLVHHPSDPGKRSHSRPKYHALLTAEGIGNMKRFAIVRVAKRLRALAGNSRNLAMAARRSAAPSLGCATMPLASPPDRT